MTTEIPVLKRSARVSRREGCVIVEHLSDEITLHGAAGELFEKMLPHIDGHTALARIAQALSEDPERLRALSQKLIRAGILALDESTASQDPSLVSGEEFYALHRRYGAHWLQPVYDHPLWDKITSGKATRAQVIGFAFEKYHYIEAAYEHMAIAAANATPEMMPHLARHFIEEYNHGDIYRVGLRSLFPNETVLDSQPLPSTRALVNLLSETAARNSFSYYAGNELLQMTENTSDSGDSGAIDKFYEAMMQKYPFTRPLIDSFIAHTRADQKLGHENVFLEMCQSVPPLTRREVNDALGTVKAMAEHLVLFLDGIDVHYERFPTVPRVPCDLLSG